MIRGLCEADTRYIETDRHAGPFADSKTSVGAMTWTRPPREQLADASALRGLSADRYRAGR
ncbi:hypothetical protein [Pseudomonas putida]|jgi:hypothetical protein|uniref:hypothetical protein n=1 Tax=Pseudomonas putida TaxID=303 RepID=UPI003F5D5383